MNRRGFLKVLIGAGAAAVALPLLDRKPAAAATPEPVYPELLTGKIGRLDGFRFIESTPHHELVLVTDDGESRYSLNGWIRKTDNGIAWGSHEGFRIVADRTTVIRKAYFDLDGSVLPPELAKPARIQVPINLNNNYICAGSDLVCSLYLDKGI